MFFLGVGRCHPPDPTCADKSSYSGVKCCSFAELWRCDWKHSSSRKEGCRRQLLSKYFGNERWHKLEIRKQNEESKTEFFFQTGETSPDSDSSCGWGDPATKNTFKGPSTAFHKVNHETYAGWDLCPRQATPWKERSFRSFPDCTVISLKGQTS